MIGESPTARAAVRGAARPRHERPLGPELDFVEGVLEFLVGWPAAGATPPAGMLSFVRYDFNERRVASLGREVRLSTEGPEPRGMHLCADPAAPVRVFERNLVDAQAHADALAARELGVRTIVLFDATKRLAYVVCGEIPWPGIELDLSRGKPDWSTDDLDRSIEDFNVDVAGQEPLMDVVTDGHGLRARGHRRYNEALYLYLRYGLGLDRRVNCGVRLLRTGLGLWPRRTAEERLFTFGRRAAGTPPRDETAVMERRLARWSTTAGRSPLRMRCLCCDGAVACAAASAPAGITVEHLHLTP